MGHEVRYYIGDIEYQEKLLQQLLMWAPETLQIEARRKMRKRIFKHFNLLGKFDGKGNLRK